MMLDANWRAVAAALLDRIDGLLGVLPPRKVVAAA